MKNSSKFFFISILIFFGACTDNDQIADDINSGLLKKIEGYFEENISQSTEILYNDNNQFIALKFSQGNFSTQTYEVNYNAEKIQSLTYTTVNSLQNTTDVQVYIVNYQDNQIMLTPTEFGNKRTFQITDGYVDSYKFYYGPDNIYFNESIFKRDANNNIESISHYATDQSVNNLLVWQYTFSDFDSNIKVNSAFNPVFNDSYSLYNSFFGAILNLKISKETPLKSSYLDANGNYREENITAEISLDQNDILKKFFYQYADFPTNNYYLEFYYD